MQFGVGVDHDEVVNGLAVAYRLQLAKFGIDGLSQEFHGYAQQAGLHPAVKANLVDRFEERLKIAASTPETSHTILLGIASEMVKMQAYAVQAAANKPH